jgi:hypothetical protein
MAAIGLILFPMATGWASFTPGAGIRAGNARISPFFDGTLGYDSNARLAEGEILPLAPDGSYQVQDEEVDDFFTQWTVGAGVSRVIQSEWDLRLRGYYENRAYQSESDFDYDSTTLEGSARFWPASDKYSLSSGGKYRESQDVERVPASAALTMPGYVPLPYLEERDDRLKRATIDGFLEGRYNPGERTAFGLNGTASTVDYDDERLFDYWNWTVSGDAGYRYSDKTYVFVEGEYELVDGDALSDDVPVYALRVGLRTKPRVKVDYHVAVGVKTYEHYTDTTGEDQERKWDWDFDALMNWRRSEKLSLFGKAWTDVSSAIQENSPENTRRTYTAQVGADYSFLRRLNAVGALSYRLDAYDFTIDFGNDLQQDKTELWQVMGRLTLSPQVNTFWKVFLESSYEIGDNELDNYDQWLIWLGLSAWY